MRPSTQKGKFWWRDEQVAEWDEAGGKMKLKGALAEMGDDYNRLMGIE